jgi:predicted nucleic acid-binding protein
MRVLVDTGVLLRAFDRSDPEQQRLIFRALRRFWSDNDELVTTAQNIAEFWNVSTRPASARGGYGLPVSVVERRVQVIERFGTVLPFPAGAYQEWRRLVVAYQITGVAVHDARIVATMRDANITHILTMNTADFRRYPGLTVLTPQNVVQS